MKFEVGKQYWGSKPRTRAKITVISRTKLYLEIPSGRAAVFEFDGNECARTNSGYKMRATDIVTDTTEAT